MSTLQNCQRLCVNTTVGGVHKIAQAMCRVDFVDPTKLYKVRKAMYNLVSDQVIKLSTTMCEHHRRWRSQN
jgi:hypothetical protein